MKFMAICLLANIGCILGTTINQLNDEATIRLRGLVEKYKLQALSNPEFSQWIGKLEKTSRSSRLIDKMKVKAEFMNYDERRQKLENKIKERIRTIDDLISDIMAKAPNKDKGCLQYYQRQRRSLRMAHNFSNLTKQTNLLRNSKQCNDTTKVQSSELSESSENPDEYSYY
ncbi:uncharacterized protein LOC116803530 [Drosophila sechellia]|uniref:uncharacterized protein LOC116803530 n=1 Tax=Drosophila sechellia TaxID=7238 RepID=UPI0013DE162E|nr:uncharacterized protein LOC116803530 [Drosophila sechellia]